MQLELLDMLDARPRRARARLRGGEHRRGLRGRRARRPTSSAARHERRSSSLGVGLARRRSARSRRFLLDGAVASASGAAFPWGTLAVNLSGAFALGVLAGAALSDDAYRLAGTGLLGAYTTFSTWMLETHRLGGGRAAAARRR